jgi:hypothetical protein
MSVSMSFCKRISLKLDVQLFEKLFMMEQGKCLKFA